MSSFERTTEGPGTSNRVLAGAPAWALPNLTKRGFSFLYSRLNSRQRLKLGRLPGILPVYRAVTRRWLKRQGVDGGLVPLHLDRFTFYIDAEEFGNGVVFDSYEPATTFVFESLVAAGDVVADVGSHWGYFTLVAATLCGNAGKVYAFEPFPANVTILTKNVLANRLGNIEIISKAVSDRSGFADLFVSQATSGNSLVQVPPGAEVSPGRSLHVAVETTTLDHFFTSLGRSPKLVKIDIEGAEIAALDGMTELIRQNKDMSLIVELNPFYFPGARGEALLRRLKGEGFQLALIDDAKFEIERGPVEEVIRTALDKGYTINLLCARGAALERVFLPSGDSGERQGRRPRIVRL